MRSPHAQRCAPTADALLPASPCGAVAPLVEPPRCARAWCTTGTCSGRTAAPGRAPSRASGCPRRLTNGRLPNRNPPAAANPAELGGFRATSGYRLQSECPQHPRSRSCGRRAVSQRGRSGLVPTCEPHPRFRVSAPTLAGLHAQPRVQIRRWGAHKLIVRHHEATGGLETVGGAHPTRLGLPGATSLERSPRLPLRPQAPALFSAECAHTRPA